MGGELRNVGVKNILRMVKGCCVMNVFVIHKGSDFDKCQDLIKRLNEQKLFINLLMLQNGGDDWFKEAKKKIRESDCVLVCIGEQTHESENVDKEIKYAIQKKKQILVYRFLPENIVNESLFVSDKYMNVKLHNNSCSNKRPMFLEIDFDKFCNLASDGYDFYIKDEIDRTDNPKRMEDLVEQYQLYVQTSESIVERRQAISSFYVGINTAIITAITTIISILMGIDMLSNKPLSIGIIMLVSSLLSVVLNSNWYLQLESYGKLNSAKMKVISALEKHMPANIFDTEWRIMSSKIGGKKYRSFTNIEKTVPMVFSVIFIITTFIALRFIIKGLS